jgi:hypothetical protein
MSFSRRLARQEFQEEIGVVLVERAQAPGRETLARGERRRLQMFGWFQKTKPAQAPLHTGKYEELKQLIHKRLVDLLSQSQAKVSELTGDTLRLEVRLVIERLVDTENPLLNLMEREQLIKDVLNMTLGPAGTEPPWWA